jgi:hypothetical protein
MVRGQVTIRMMLRAVLQVNPHPSETPLFVDDTHGAGSVKADPDATWCARCVSMVSWIWTSPVESMVRAQES